MEYGVEFWSVNTFKEGLEGVQKTALENIGRLNDSDYLKLIEEMGVHKIHTESEKRKLAYGYKLETMNKNRIPHKLYDKVWQNIPDDKKLNSFKAQINQLLKVLLSRLCQCL